MDQMETVSIARRLSPANGAFVVEIERVDLAVGRITFDLLRLSARGNMLVTLPLKAPLDQVEQDIAECMADGDPAAQICTLLADGAELVPLSAKVAAFARTLNEALKGRFTHTASGQGHIVALEQTSGDALIHVDVAGDVRSIKAGDLRLGTMREVTGMIVSGRQLYIAVADSLSGFDLFGLDLRDPKAELQTVLTRGSFRFSLNAAISAMLPVEGGLLLGSAALASGTSQTGNWGCELILVSADNSWDLLIGQPRFSPDGLKLPASAMIPGLGQTHNCAIKAIAHGATKRGQTTVIALQDFMDTPEDDRRKVRPDLSAYHGKLRLFMSSNFVDWFEVFHHLSQDIGPVTALCLTSGGLLVGYEQEGAEALPVSFVPII